MSVLLLSFLACNINRGQGTVEIDTLWTCSKREPSTEVHVTEITEIVNGPSYTDMASLCSPFLLHFLPLSFQTVAVWSKAIFFAQLSVYRSISHYWDS